jgi:replicative DNA helicase
MNATTNGPHNRMAGLLDTEPPHSIEAEMSLLGALLIEPAAAAEVRQTVKPEDFYDERHVLLFRAIVEVCESTPEAALLALADRLRRSGGLDAIGGSAYLERLARQTPGVAGIPYYTKLIADYGRVRALLKAGSDIMHRALTSDTPAAEQVEQAEAQVFAIAETNGELSQAEPLAEIIDREIARIESGVGPSGQQTHFVDLDELTCGLQPGDMIVLAARPSMGKSALMLNIAEQMALGGTAEHPSIGTRRKVGIFTMEMSKASIAQRMLSARSGVSCSSLRGGGVSAGTMEKIAQAAMDLSACIYPDDATALSIGAVRSRARRMVKKWGVEVLFIDYLQLMTAPGSSKESRQVEVSAISRGIKGLARELNIPIVVLSQLNRSAESRAENRPRMSDLRESGAIEQDADVILLLHREAYYHVGDQEWLARNSGKENAAELIIAKQRNGPTDTVHLVWDSVATRFKTAAKYGRYGDAA